MKDRPPIDDFLSDGPSRNEPVVRTVTPGELIAVLGWDLFLNMVKAVNLGLYLGILVLVFRKLTGI